MNNVDQEQRTQELIMQYNAHQNPEEVIKLMAHIIVELEDDNEELLAGHISLTSKVEGLREDVRTLERGVHEAYCIGVQAGNDRNTI